jgi:hypothetical protein
MAMDKTLNHLLVNTLHGTPCAAQPPAEMLDSLNVLLNCRWGMPTLGQIRDVVIDRGAEHARPKPTQNTRRAKYMLDHDCFLSALGLEERPGSCGPLHGEMLRFQLKRHPLSIIRDSA